MLPVFPKAGRQADRSSPAGQMHSDICGAGLLLFGLLLCEDEGRMLAELLHLEAATANQ